MIRGRFPFCKKEKRKVVWMSSGFIFICLAFSFGFHFTGIENLAHVRWSLLLSLICSALLYVYVGQKEIVTFDTEGISIEKNGKLNWFCDWNELSEVTLHQTGHTHILEIVKKDGNSRRFPISLKLQNLLK